MNTNDQDSAQSLSKLLRLKRHEKPPEHYFTTFLYDFHRNLRSSIPPSRLATAWENFLNLWPEIRVPHFAYAAAAALALAAGIFITISPTTSSRTAPSLLSIHRAPDLTITERVPVDIGLALPAAFYPASPSQTAASDTPQVFSPRPMLLDCAQ